METIAELIEREKSTMEEMAARKIQLDRLQDRQKYLEAELVLVRRLKFQFELLAKKISEASISSNFTSQKS